MTIRNAGGSANIKARTFNKSRAKPKGNRFRIPNHAKPRPLYATRRNKMKKICIVGSSEKGPTQILYLKLNLVNDMIFIMEYQRH